jgi:hypothetical protein
MIELQARPGISHIVDRRNVERAVSRVALRRVAVATGQLYGITETVSARKCPC